MKNIPIYVIAALLISAVSAVAVIKIGNDGSTEWFNDNTVIKNSNGKIWSASAANFRSAVWDLNSTNGGVVQMPQCNITIDFDLKKSNITIKGVPGTVFTRTSNGGHCMDVFANHVVFDTIEIYGNYANDNTVWGTHGINLRPGYHNLTVRNCYIHKTNESSIRLRSNTSHCLIENNKLEFTDRKATWPAGVYAEGRYHKICKNMIIDTGACGIVIEGDDDWDWNAHGFVVDSNVITGSIDHGIHMETSFARNCVISNNVIHSLVDTDHYANNYGISAWDDSTVAGNVIYNMPDLGINAGKASTIVGNTVFNCVDDAITVNNHNCNVNDNIIHNISADGININAWGCIVSGNQIYDITATGSGIKTASGKDRATIIGNNLYEVDGHGIRLYNTDYSVVSGNTMYDCGGAGSSYHSINIQGDFNAITGNMVDTCSDGIYTSSAENCTIAANVLVACTDDGIDLNTGNSNNVNGNVISGCGTGIESSDGGATITVDNIIG